MAHPLFSNFSAGKFSGGTGNRMPPQSPGPSGRPPRSGLQAIADILVRALGQRAVDFLGTPQTEEAATRLVEDALRRLKPDLFPADRTRPEPQRSHAGATRSQPTPRANLVRIGGRILNVPPNDALLTGEMVNVQSSNVHSIGYGFNRDHPERGTLKVRFLQPDHTSGSRGKVPGPLYQYFDVHPFIFMAMRESASKGKFVWDKLRIRGTVSGHRYRYRLAGIAQGYVPRQATLRMHAQEWFVQRTIRVGDQVLRSQLPTRLVRTLDTRKHHEILISGAPYRGSPVRGQPFRGR